MPRDTIFARESRRWLAPPRHKEDKFFSAVLPKLPLGFLAYESRYRSLACSSTHTDTHAYLYSTILLSPHGNKDKHARQSYVLPSFFYFYRTGGSQHYRSSSRKKKPSMDAWFTSWTAWIRRHESSLLREKSPTTLTIDLHHLYYLLLRCEGLGYNVGPLDVSCRAKHAAAVKGINAAHTKTETLFFFSSRRRHTRS